MKRASVPYGSRSVSAAGSNDVTRDTRGRAESGESMKNQTRNDARARMSEARTGSLVNPSYEYLLALRQGLYAWIENVDEKIAELAAAKHYEVIVGNVGSVHKGLDRDEAELAFSQYVELSEKGVGRVGGEDVVLLEDDEPIEEYEGQVGDRLGR